MHPVRNNLRYIGASDLNKAYDRMHGRLAGEGLIESSWSTGFSRSDVGKGMDSAEQVFPVWRTDNTCVAISKEWKAEVKVLGLNENKCKSEFAAVGKIFTVEP